MKTGCNPGKMLNVYRIGEPIVFSGYVDDFERSISAVEFSLDDGAHWTRYATPGARAEEGVSWQLRFIPDKLGIYRMKVRAVDGEGMPAALLSEIPFQVFDQAAYVRHSLVRAGGPTLHIRALGGRALEGAPLFRSEDLHEITAVDADLIRQLGIGTVYDIRTRHEVTARPDLLIAGVYTVALEPGQARRKDASSRLVAGVIGEYGAPEERMRANYRRYVQEYPLIGKALRMIAQQTAPGLVHCANGKDRTGVLCAVLQRIGGVHRDDILDDYLVYNIEHAEGIEAEADRLGQGMSEYERRILASFLEARPAYLQAFFDEVTERFGTFERYVEEGLRLSESQREALISLVN